MNKWVIRLAKIVLVTEIVYLILINAALNLPWTQTVVNIIKPERYMVTWERAWSFYPFHIHARSISANGQSRSVQWQAEAPVLQASISPLALLWRTVKLSDIKGEDIMYKQRPRPQPEKDYTSIQSFFPTIDNRKEETAVATSPTKKKGKKAWRIILNDIYASGNHKIWISQILGQFSGELRTDFSFQTSGGPLSLANGEFDVELESLIINGDSEILKEVDIEGSVALLPFVPKENKGIKVLNFLETDARIEAETESLAFLNIYLANFQGLKIDGTGFVQGRLHMQQGSFEEGCNIEVAATKLSLDFLDHRLEGEGKVSIKAPDNSDDTHVLITFAGLKASDLTRDVLLFSGDGVSVEARSNRFILPGADKPFIAKRLAFVIPEVEVPDLAAYQNYLPDSWSFTLHGGTGKLQGFTEVTQTGLSTELNLVSEAADVGFKEYRFTSNLDTAIKIDSPSVGSGVDFSGSYIHLQGAKLSNDDQQTSKPWHAGLDISQGKIRLLLPEDVPDKAGFIEIYTSIKDKDIVTLLDSSDDDLIINGSISDLAWLSLLIENRFGLSIKGSGELEATVDLNQGWPGTGSKLVIISENLGVDVLDYSTEGDGKATLLVENGGEQPDLMLDVELVEGIMQRKDESQAFIENVEMKLQATAKDIAAGDKDLDMDLHLQIPHANISDMSTYNQYLPPESPLQFVGGKAELSADIAMSAETAEGYVKLRTDDISAHVDEQTVEGELRADILLVGGVPENMDFDISGSSVTLDNVRVAGAEASHDEENWAVRFLLKKARAVWKRPVSIQLEADLDMTDSKPIVAVIANQRGKHGWLEKALTIDDVSGEAVMEMEEDRIVIPYAFATSDNIEVGAKGVITPENRNGILYVRFKKLHGILKIDNGDRNVDVLNAREKFEQFDSRAKLVELLSP